VGRTWGPFGLPGEGMSSPGPLAGLILSAGYSSRMGTLKAALPIGDVTVLERAVRLLSGVCDPVVAVLGHRMEELAPLARSSGAAVVENPRYHTGMFSSIQAGVGALADLPVRGLVMLPVDVPLVRPCTVRSLVASYRGQDALVPAFKGKRGHPPVISRGRFGEILAFQGQGGLRSLMDLWEVEELPVLDRHVLMDMDSPEDYRRVLDRLPYMDVPDREECLELLRIMGTPTGVVEHSLKVAEVGLRIGRVLADAGYELDVEAIRSGCLLHDLAKGGRDHEAEGGRILSEMGFTRLGEMVASHRDLPEGASMEAQVLYLADKSVMSTRLVALEERMEAMEARFAGDPPALEAARRRIRRAMGVRALVEEAAGGRFWR